jgi:hypothetical protein
MSNLKIQRFSPGSWTSAMSSMRWSMGMKGLKSLIQDNWAMHDTLRWGIISVVLCQTSCLSWGSKYKSLDEELGPTRLTFDLPAVHLVIKKYVEMPFAMFWGNRYIVCLLVASCLMKIYVTLFYIPYNGCRSYHTIPVGLCKTLIWLNYGMAQSRMLTAGSLSAVRPQCPAFWICCWNHHPSNWSCSLARWLGRQGWLASLQWQVDGKLLVKTNRICSAKTTTGGRLAYSLAQLLPHISTTPYGRTVCPSLPWTIRHTLTLASATAQQIRGSLGCSHAFDYGQQILPSSLVPWTQTHHWGNPCIDDSILLCPAWPICKFSWGNMGQNVLTFISNTCQNDWSLLTTLNFCTASDVWPYEK